jgi:membrane-bound serine protease (ClpP class)
MTGYFVIILLLVGGMVALLAELAVLPGHGIGAVIAALFVLGGVWYAWTRYGVSWGVGSLLIAGTAAAVLIKVIPRTRAGRSLILSTVVSTPLEDSVCVGAEGHTLTALRPSGAVEIAGQRINVVTDGLFVEPGRRVRVVSINGARILVAPIG